MLRLRSPAKPAAGREPLESDPGFPVCDTILSPFQFRADDTAVTRVLSNHRRTSSPQQSKRKAILAVIDITNTFVVDASPEEAFALMADINKHLEIFSMNREIRDYHGGPVREGDTWQIRSSFMGRDTVTKYTLSEYAEPNRLVFESRSASGDGVITWEFAPVAGGTQVTQHAVGEPKGFLAGVAGVLLKGNLENQLRADGERFKALVEGSTS